MPITLDQIGTVIRSRIINSGSLLGLCDSLYDKPHSVYYASAGPEGPPDSDCPLIIILPQQKSAGDASNSYDFNFLIGIAVIDDSLTEAVTVEGVKSVIYGGASNIEQLCDMVGVEIRAISDNVNFDVFDVQIGQEDDSYPLFIASMRVGVSVSKLIGATVEL